MGGNAPELKRTTTKNASIGASKLANSSQETDAHAHTHPLTRTGNGGSTRKGTRMKGTTTKNVSIGGSKSANSTQGRVNKKKVEGHHRRVAQNTLPTDILGPLTSTTSTDVETATVFWSDFPVAWAQRAYANLGCPFPP